MAIFKRKPNRPTYGGGATGGQGKDFFKPMPMNAIKWGLTKVNKVKRGPVKHAPVDRTPS